MLQAISCLLSFSIALLSLVSLEETIRKAEAKQSKLSLSQGQNPKFPPGKAAYLRVLQSTARKALSVLKLLFYNRRHF